MNPSQGDEPGTLKGLVSLNGKKNRTTPTPDSVSGEQPAWLEELNDAAFGGRPESDPEDWTRQYEGAEVPMPSEAEARKQAEDRIRAEQGELVQYGAEGPPTPTSPDAPAPDLPDLGQGPECPDEDCGQ